MKKRYKILIAVLLILLMVFGFLIFKYQRLIRAVWDGLTLSSEKIESMQIENEKNTTEIVSKLGVDKIKPLSEDEEKELLEGNITQEEAINIVLGNKTIDEIKNEKTSGNVSKDVSDKSQKDSSNQVVTNNTAQTNNNNDSLKQQKIKQANERISTLIGEIYVLKSSFKNELKKVEDWVESEYRALTKEERAPKQSPAEQAIGKQMFSKVSALEAECDGKMKSILEEMKTLLQETGQDVSLVNQIRDAYENEKQITKSSYINKYR